MTTTSYKGNPLWELIGTDEGAQVAQEYLAEKQARASLVLIRMGCDGRLPRDATGYVRDLGEFKTGRDVELRWRFLHDRLNMLKRHIPDLCSEFADAIGFHSKSVYCRGCGKNTTHVGPRSEFCEICGHTSGDFDT